jgi:tetratricopeptide (TPR) repeat protein
MGLLLAACGTWSTRPTPSAREAVVTVHRQKAAVLEADGRLRSALDHLEVVLAVDPENADARQARQRLQARVDRELAERLRQGREALDRGNHPEARRHFLAVLALDPGNDVAFEALRSEVPEARSVPHRVRRGETLPGLAERYYGDRSRAEVIGEANRLPVTARPAPGTTLRIPEIPGVPLLSPDARSRPREETREPHPLVAEARDAFERGEYAVAAALVDRVLAGQPQHAEGLELKKGALLMLGRSQVDQQRDAEAYQTLSQLVKLAPTYQDAGILLRGVRDRLVQRHYSEGLRLFRDEKLEEAIAEWRTVLELDPQHVNARRNLEQADRLLKSLEERRKRP